MKKVILALLHINGWVAVLIGSLIVLDPVSMLSSYGLQPDLSIGLLSELGAPGGLLIACGLMIIRSTMIQGLLTQGLQLSVMVYGSFGAVRLLGFVLDGQPPTEILIATSIELMLCGLSLLAVWKQAQLLHMTKANQAIGKPSTTYWI